MPNYRRYRVPGGTYFFTVNLLERRKSLLVEHIDVLRDAIRQMNLEQQSESSDMNVESGSAGFGNIPFVMNLIMRVMLMTFIIILSNTVL